MSYCPRYYKLQYYRYNNNQEIKKTAKKISLTSVFFYVYNKYIKRDSVYDVFIIIIIHNILIPFIYLIFFFL